MNCAERCRRNGWGPGTQLVGDDGYGPTVIEITAVGQTQVLAKLISHDGFPQGGHEGLWMLYHHHDRWQVVVPGDKGR